MKHLEAPIIDFKLRGPRKTGHAACESVQEIHEELRHDERWGIEIWTVESEWSSLKGGKRMGQRCDLAIEITL